VTLLIWGEVGSSSGGIGPDEGLDRGKRGFNSTRMGEGGVSGGKIEGKKDVFSKATEVLQKSKGGEAQLKTIEK